MKKKPFKAPFPFVPEPGQYITSVVVDRDDFVTFMDLIRTTCPSKLDEETAEHALEMGHVPLIARGTLTEQLFDHFDVETKYMSVCVRGYGKRLFDSLE